MKKNDNKKAIYCNPRYGPVFGNTSWFELMIKNECGYNNHSFIKNDGQNVYECHPKYRSSLFVGTYKPDEKNNFKVSDYEVFTYE